MSTPASSPSPNTSARILIADADAMVRGSLAAVLESEGYTVEEARNGREAVKQAVANPPNLMLLDLNMPAVDGWTALAQVRRANPHLPVIIITAAPNQSAKAKKLGVDALMEKPLHMHPLLAEIKRLTEREPRIGR